MKKNTTNQSENARFQSVYFRAALLNAPTAPEVVAAKEAARKAAEARAEAEAADHVYQSMKREAAKAEAEAARLAALITADPSKPLTEAADRAARIATKAEAEARAAKREADNARKAAKRAEAQQEAAEAIAATVGAALSRRFYAFITTEEKQAADDMTAKAKKAARNADRAEATARAAKARADRMERAADLDESTKAAEAAKAEEKAAKAREARAVADTLTEEAARLAADPAAALIAYHIPAAAIIATGSKAAAATIARDLAAAFVERNAAHFAAAKLAIFPDLSTALERGESTDPKARAAMEEARAAFIGFDAPEMVARQSAKARSRTECTPLSFELRKAAEARDHNAPDLADIESAARSAITAAAYGMEADAQRMEAEAEAIRAAEAQKPAKNRAQNAERTAADLDRAAAAIRERIADPAAPFWMLTARRAAFLAVNNHYTAARKAAEAERPDRADLEKLTATEEEEAAPVVVPMEEAEAIADPAQQLEADPEEEAEAAKAEAIRAAFEKLTAALSPTRRAILADLVTGYTPAQITRRKGYANHATTCEHIAAIRSLFAAFLSERPDLFNAARFSSFLCDSTAAEVIEAEAAKAAKEEKRNAKAEAAADFAKAKEAEAITAAALATLSPIRRRLLFAIKEGGSIRAAAAIIGRNEATAREHIAAIRRALFSALSEARQTEAAEAVKHADFTTIAPTLCGSMTEA